MVKNPDLLQSQGTKPKIYYGYIVVAAAFCMLLAAYGVRFSYGIFFTPMATELGWNSASVSLVYSISMLVEGVFNIILGGLTDRFGPRIILTGAGICLGAGYCLMWTVHSTWQFFLFYGILVGIGMGGIFVPLVSVTTRWFSARRGVMTGTVMSGAGVGVLILSPLIDQLIKGHGWRDVYIYMGIMVLVFIVVGAQFIKHDPAEIGLAPDGKPLSKIQSTPVKGDSFKKACNTLQLWFVFLIFTCYGYLSISISVHLVPDAISAGISSIVAAIIMSTLAISQIFSRVGLGTLGDRLGNRVIFMIGFIICFLDLIWGMSNQSVWAFFIFAAFFGIAQGGISTTQSQIIAELFGVKSHGLLFGFCGFGFTIGAAIGPYVTGHIFDITGSYRWGFVILAIVAACALGLTIILKMIKNVKIVKTSN